MREYLRRGGSAASSIGDTLRKQPPANPSGSRRSMAPFGEKRVFIPKSCRRRRSTSRHCACNVSSVQMECKGRPNSAVVALCALSYVHTWYYRTVVRLVYSKIACRIQTDCNCVMCAALDYEQAADTVGVLARQAKSCCCQKRDLSRRI